MAQEGKKISFGFSKIIKKPDLKPPQLVTEKKVDYIDCVDDKSIKVIGGEDKKNLPIIIPMLESTSWRDRIVNKINADIYGEKKENNQEINHDKNKEIKTKNELDNDLSINDDYKIKNNVNGALSNNINIHTHNNSQSLSLEEQAAVEIIRDLNDTGKVKENESDFVIEQTTNLFGETEPTMEDYEDIPIEQFGLAMLRGMGWEPDKGVGKNAKVVSTVTPVLRPRCSGLGADKIQQQKSSKFGEKNEKKLKLEKGGFVKVIAGKHNGNYGIIEGFDDDDPGRIIVKLALTNEVVSLNEFIVERITKDQYEINSRVLNTSKYEKYKDKSIENNIIKNQNKPIESSSSESNEPNKEITHNNSKQFENHKSLKKKSRGSSRGNKKYSSDSDSDSNDDSATDDDHQKYKRHEKSTNSQNEHCESKKSKKSQKHRHRDSSESKNRKSLKKERQRDKSHNYRDDKKKHRKHKRSRSRSRSPTRSGRK